MIKKKSGVLILSFLLSFLFIGVVSSASCSITTSCSSDSVVMGLYDTTNSHGAEWNDGDLDTPYYLCCDFTGTHVCSGNNKILGLSSVSNAHAEIPSNDNYATDVCFGNLVCTGRTTCQSGETEIFSLSSETNAHIGSPGDYSTKICCEGLTPSAQLEVFWADKDGEPIDSTEESPLSIPTGYSVKMVVLNSGLSQGNVDFEVYEKDTLVDDKIRTTSTDNEITGNVDSNGKALATWTIKQADIDAAESDDSDGDYEFYFRVNDDNDLESGDLHVEINLGFCSEIFSCSNYDNSVNCEADPCGVAEASVHENAPEITCGNGYECGCWWDETKTENQCGPYWDGIGGGDVCDENDECWLAGDLCQDDCTCYGTSIPDGNGACVDNPNAVCDENDECWLAGDLCQDDCTCEPGYEPNGEGSCGSGTACVPDTDECWLAGDLCQDDCTCYGTSIPDGNGACVDNPNAVCDENDECWLAGDLCQDDCTCFGTSSPDDEGACIGGEIPAIVGTCKYHENTGEDPEGCEDDGYLSYSWGATWDWGENLFSSNPDGTDYVEVPLESSQWHYDPIRKYLKCKDGSGKVECPAQIQLPFFGIHSLIAAIILIIVIYLILNMKKHEKSKKKK